MVNLASDIPVIAQWGHEMCGQSSMDGAYAWAQQQRLPLTEAELAAAIGECSMCQQWRPTPSP